MARFFFLTLLIVVCAAEIVAACRKHHHVSQDVEPVNEEKHLFTKQRSGPKSGCFCSRPDDLCACCEHLSIPKIRINDTGCVEVIYLAHDIGLSLIFEIDHHVFINKTVSARNPPPICYDVPDFDAAEVCVQFYNLAFYNKELSGCMRVIAELEDVKIFSMKIGCFNLPMISHVDHVHPHHFLNRNYKSAE